MEQVGAIRSIVVMGVAGSGKTTIGSALAERLGFVFVEGDLLHSSRDVERMGAGHPLSDVERLPWLRAVGQALEAARIKHLGVVAACSALKRAYRDVLREYVADVFFVLLAGDEPTIRARAVARHHAYMPASLVASQFAILEELEGDERGIRVDVTSSPDEIVDRVEHELRRHAR